MTGQLHHRLRHDPWRAGQVLRGPRAALGDAALALKRRGKAPALRAPDGALRPGMQAEGIARTHDTWRAGRVLRDLEQRWVTLRSR
jgi:hypothetical protein